MNPLISHLGKFYRNMHIERGHAFAVAGDREGEWRGILAYISLPRDI